MASTVSSSLWIVSIGLIFIFTANAEEDISWNVNLAHIRQGESVEVMCSANDVSLLDAVKIELHRDGKPVLEVAANGELEIAFINSGRYSVNMETKDDEPDYLAVRLNISAARGEDSGTLVCYTVTQPERTVSIPLTVDVPVKDIYFEVQNGSDQVIRVDSGYTFTMKEGLNTGVMCVALIDGSQRPATMTLTLGGEDVTNEFLMTNAPLVVEMKDHLDTETNKATASYITTLPDKRFDSKRLTCTAQSLMGYQKEAEMYLKVFYVPIITCKLVEYFAQLEKPIEVICHVVSNPTATMSYFYESGNSPAVIKEHPHADQFRIEPEPISENEVKVKFNIHRVHGSHFGKYIIRAANDYGQKETEFFIRQGALDEDKEPTILTPTLPKITVPEPTKTQVVVKLTPPKEEPETNQVLEPQEPQASLNGASTLTVSMTMLIALSFVHISSSIILRR